MSHRKARFTSSNIYKLIKSGRGDNEFSAPGLTYIQEKQIETKLGRSLDLPVYSKAIAWGNLMEKIVWMKYFEKWTLISKDYRFHTELGDHWSGIPDMEQPGEIAEIKCYQLKNFSLYSECLMKQDIESFRKDFPQEYWQLVSNAIINKVDKVTAISFMPYLSDLEWIIEGIEDTGLLEKFEFNPWEFRFMTEDNINDLPYINEGEYFQSVTAFSFEIPFEDKEFLTERVKKAINYIKTA